MPQRAYDISDLKERKVFEIIKNNPTACQYELGVLLEEANDFQWREKTFMHLLRYATNHGYIMRIEKKGKVYFELTDKAR